MTREVRRVFVDTSAFFALADVNSREHRAAERVQELLVRTRASLYATNFVLAETHSLLLARLGRYSALAVLLQLMQAQINWERISITDEARALAILRQYDDKNFSYVDATSFAVMERVGVREAFSFDRNFRQFGLSVLPEQLT